MELSMSAQEVDAVTTTTNPAYELMKRGGEEWGEGTYEYEVLSSYVFRDWPSYY